ncbi:hypothetical protein MGSAQ_000334 [marine sediment metagenome]|uniref:Uncharacterized protein n=1 Tax=marine sediment metagenome TaxID=412755 RepID=A0A1B6NXL4_9ZZZZ
MFLAAQIVQAFGHAFHGFREEYDLALHVVIGSHARAVYFVVTVQTDLLLVA